jgi:hypothetical protein|tara:strand:- start:2904 stop:3137 length:234 start_codon:yes stop_codon:yes gene_type:complete
VKLSNLVPKPAAGITAVFINRLQIINVYKKDDKENVDILAKYSIEYILKVKKELNKLFLVEIKKHNHNNKKTIDKNR